MKFLKALTDAVTGTIGLFFQESKWVGTPAYQQQTARRNAQLDQVAQRV
jgi:hypothetical protein